MRESTDPWRRYAKRQEELARSTQVDHRSWGLEAGLDALLEDIGAASDEDADRAASTRARRERHHRALIAKNPNPTESVHSPEGPVEARRQLRLIRERLNEDETSLLSAIGEGNTPLEIAAELGEPVVRVRVRLFRLRRRLAAYVEPAVAKEAA